MSHTQSRLARLVTALPPTYLKDPIGAAALQVQCSPGATWTVEHGVIKTTPVSGDAIAITLREHTFTSLATAINAVTNYTASVLGSVGALKASTLLDTAVPQAAATSIQLAYYTAANYILLGPVARALDDFDDAFEEAVTQLDMRHAGGVWLDRWGTMSGLPRLQDETDLIYAARVRGTFIGIKQNGHSLVQRVLESTRVSSAFIADGIIDNFKRDDVASPLGSTDSGTPWQIDSGVWGIQSSKAYCSAPGSASIGFSADGFGEMRFGESSGAATAVLGGMATLDGLYWGLPVQVRLTTKATGQRLIFRQTVPGSEFYVEVRSDRYALVKTVVTAATDLGTWVSTPVNGDLVRVTFSGNDISVFINGVLRIGPITDAFNNTAHRYGIAISDSSAAAARFDEFQVGTPGAFTLVSTMAGGSAVQDQTNVQSVVNRFKAGGMLPTFVFL